MDSSHISHTCYHEHQHHEINTHNYYFCEVPIPPSFSWHLLENMVRPKGTPERFVRTETGKNSKRKRMTYIEWLVMVITVSQMIKGCKSYPGVELGNEETYENEYFRDNINHDLGKDDEKIFRNDKPKSQLRFGYGLKFGFKGAALHGLNRYNVIIGIDIPDIRIAQFFKPRVPDQEYCERFNHPQFTNLHKVCSRTWPAYIEMIQSIGRYQDEMEEILYGDLPAVLPGFQVSDLGPNPWEHNHYVYKIAERTNDVKRSTSLIEKAVSIVKETYKRTKRAVKIGLRRGKRFISDLIGLGIQGITALLNHRKQNELKKGMKMLAENQEAIQGEIKVMKDEMLSITQTHMRDIKELRDDIMVLGQGINALNRQIEEHEFDILSLKSHQVDVDNSLEYLSDTIADLFGRMQRYLSLYVQMHEKLNNLLDAIDDLEKGELSHRVISHREMSKIVNHVVSLVEAKYPAYELVLEDTHNYYNLPLVVYAYNKGTIAIQIPMFLKLKVQEPLHLYTLTTVPVPFHINEQEMEEQESKYTHTKLIPSTEILGMSSDTYVNLDRYTLEECYKIGTVYFCEALILTKQKDEHTCESAIYHYEHLSEIKRKCTFEYYPYLEPEPELLDAGEYFLLSHLPTPWTVHCKHTDQLPGPMEGSAFVVIMKSDMCDCELQAGVGVIWHVQGNIEYCPQDLQKLRNDIALYYPVNMAVMIYQCVEEVKRLRLTDNSLFVRPYPFDPEEPNVVVQKESNILDRENPSVELNEVMINLKERKYASKEDYAIAITEPKNWVNGRSPWFGFLLFGVLGTFLLTLIVIPWIAKTCSISDKIQKLTTGIARVAAVQGISPPMITALDKEEFVSLEVQGGFGLLMTVLFIVAVIFGLWLLKQLLRAVCRYYEMYNLSSIQTKKSWYNYMEFDKTHIYVQLQHPAQPVSMELYMGTYFGNPESLVVRRDFQDLDMEFEPKCLFDYININWNRCSLALRNLELQTPDFIQVPILKKYVVRRVFAKKHVKFRLVAYNPSTCKIRALGDFKLCKARVKGNYSPDSLPQHGEQTHDLPLKTSTPNLHEWQPNLKKLTYDLDPYNRQVERPNQLTFMPMDTPSFDSLPSPLPASPNPSIEVNIGHKDEPATSRTVKAEVYV